jgi:hypothetical protein
MTRIWSREPRTLWRRSGDRVLVLPPGTDELLLLTGTGRVTWELLEQALPEAALVTALAQVYGTEEATIARDLDPFLQSMAAAGAVAGP